MRMEDMILVSRTDTTWLQSPENSARTPRDQTAFEALRARAANVDTTRMSRAEWKRRNEAAGIGLV
jgi:hypothetical protein